MPRNMTAGASSSTPSFVKTAPASIRCPKRLHWSTLGSVRPRFFAPAASSSPTTPIYTLTRTYHDRIFSSHHAADVDLKVSTIVILQGRIAGAVSPFKCLRALSLLLLLLLMGSFGLVLAGVRAESLLPMSTRSRRCRVRALLTALTAILIQSRKNPSLRGSSTVLRTSTSLTVVACSTATSRTHHRFRALLFRVASARHGRRTN